MSKRLSSADRIHSMPPSTGCIEARKPIALKALKATGILECDGHYVERPKVPGLPTRSAQLSGQDPRGVTSAALIGELGKRNTFTNVNVRRFTPKGMPITVTQLTAFLAIIRGGSVTAAADELVVTQPSVSSAVAALSRELGCDLFERAGRGIRLTDAGMAFAPYAEDVLGLLEKGRTAAREAASVTARRRPSS